MNPFLRYWKFNLVGAMGMVVQLAALALSTARCRVTTFTPRPRPSN